MKIGILVHGRHLQAEGWEKLVWGVPEEGRLGSLPMMVLIALTVGIENIGAVVFGTGASEKGGLKEAEYTKRYLLKNMSELGQFDKLAFHPRFQSRRDLVLLDGICREIIPETQSKNTAEEIANAAKIFKNIGCGIIYQISCGSHIPRCTIERLKIAERGGIPADQLWLSVADDMTFSGSTAGDVAIIEPPHRGDDPMIRAPKKAHEVVPKLFKLSPLARTQFLSDLDVMLDERILSNQKVD